MQTLDEQALIAAIAYQVRASLEGESSGHDWWHIHRVWQTACRIARNCDADVLVVQLAALLHDAATSPCAAAKVELYRTARAQGITKAELGRRLAWRGPQVDRLFDLRHPSKIEQIDRALRIMGKRLAVTVRDAA